MLYAGLHNITTSNHSSRANSAAPSRRASEKGSTHSESEEQTYQPTTTTRRSSLKKALDFLSPYENSPYEKEDKVEKKSDNKALKAIGRQLDLIRKYPL
jgi:hypothetical protein